MTQEIVQGKEIYSMPQDCFHQKEKKDYYRGQPTSERNRGPLMSARLYSKESKLPLQGLG